MSCGRYITHLTDCDTGVCRECGHVDAEHLAWRLRLEANAADVLRHYEMAQVMRAAADYIAPAQAGEAQRAEIVQHERVTRAEVVALIQRHMEPRLARQLVAQSGCRDTAFAGFLLAAEHLRDDVIYKLAQAGEAGTAATPQSGVAHEHAVAKGDAPKE